MVNHSARQGSFQPRFSRAPKAVVDTKANNNNFSTTSSPTTRMNRSTFTGVHNNNNMRRSSIGVPVSALIFPRSAADRHESIKLTKETEEKYGFHYFTNTFCENLLMEMDYTSYFIETSINPACYASIFSWFLWILISVQDAYSSFSDNSFERTVAYRKLLISLMIFIPVPILVACCRAEKYNGKEQLFLCAIVHCFAFVILSGGAFPLMKEYRGFLMKDYDFLKKEEYLNITNKLSDKITLDVASNDTQWYYPTMVNQTGVQVMDFYMEDVVLQIAHLNISLLRPLIILVVAPMFKLDPFHYIFTAFTINIGFCALVAALYPQTKAIPFLINKFMLIFILVGISMVLVFRVRQTDRFLRLNFLHAKTVEEKARASYLQKEFILNENKSLKKLLEEKTKKNSSEPLDFDSPMAKVILDLKNLQRTASLSPELRENLDGIVLLLSKKGQNLFAPDIHEQLKQKRAIDLDGDTKSWATTVLASKAYTRNRRTSANGSSPLNSSSDIPASNSNPISSTTLTSTTKTASTSSTISSTTSNNNSTEQKNGASEDSTSGISSSRSQGSTSVQPQYTIAPLHSDVLSPSEKALIAVSDMMDKDGWNVDTHLVSEMSNGKPLSYITYILFERHNLFTLCSVDKNTLASFLWFLDIGYLHNPYHSNCHAADVVSSVEYLVVDNCLIHDLLTTQEVFAALIAAAIHDFRHPGKTNNFMVKSGSDLAIEYSDSSVLERMHLAEAFFLTKDPVLNIFSRMAPLQYAEVRKAIIEMVLSTDLSLHLQLVGSLKTALISQDNSDIIHSPMMMMKIVIKCADIGHSSKATALHARWSDLIIEEFFLQGDDEAMLGMDISPFMNRNSENSAKNQVGFFEFIILPFFEVVSEVVFRPEFKTILDQAHKNYKMWKKAETLQLNSIKDILDQVFLVESLAATVGTTGGSGNSITGSTHHISPIPSSSRALSPTGSHERHELPNK